jgi:hypothetical protein
MGNDMTTVSVSRTNKDGLNDARERVFGNTEASYDATIGFLVNYYQSNS